MNFLDTPFNEENRLALFGRLNRKHLSSGGKPRSSSNSAYVCVCVCGAFRQMAKDQDLIEIRLAVRGREPHESAADSEEPMKRKLK